MPWLPCFWERAGRKFPTKTVNRLVLLAIFGAALLYGDGLITPVISVLSAVEGLNVATHAAEPYVLPLSCLVILGLFLFQSQGTERIGKIFGPIMIFWFASLAVLGLIQIFQITKDFGITESKLMLSFFLLKIISMAWWCWGGGSVHYRR